jgi:hypothetical protein
VAEKEYEYKTVTNRYVDKFNESVNMEMCNGWKPIGGVAVTLTSTVEHLYAQALIRQKE